MDGLIFYAVILLATPAFGWTPKNDDDLGFFFPGKYFYNPRYGPGQFLESLKDMGYKDELIQTFNKTPKHEFDFGYVGNGKGSGKIEMTRVFGNIERVTKDVYLGKEFVETLWDDRKSKTTLIQEDILKLSIHQKIEGGPHATTTFQGVVAEGVFNVTVEIMGKAMKEYLLADF